jgi:hypothetical protein
LSAKYCLSTPYILPIGRKKTSPLLEIAELPQEVEDLDYEIKVKSYVAPCEINLNLQRSNHSLDL